MDFIGQNSRDVFHPNKHSPKDCRSNNYSRDFFTVVRKGQKSKFLECVKNLDYLEGVRYGNTHLLMQRA